MGCQGYMQSGAAILMHMQNQAMYPILHGAVPRVRPSLLAMYRSSRLVCMYRLNGALLSSTLQAMQRLAWGGARGGEQYLAVLQNGALWLRCLGQCPSPWLRPQAWADCRGACLLAGSVCMLACWTRVRATHRRTRVCRGGAGRTVEACAICGTNIAHWRWRQLPPGHMPHACVNMLGLFVRGPPSGRGFTCQRMQMPLPVSALHVIACKNPSPAGWQQAPMHP